MSVPSRLLENLTRVLRSSWGLDVVSQPFAIQRYNAAVLEIDHAEWTVQTFGRERTMAVVVGNTGQMWESLVAHFADKDPGQDPVESYTELAVNASARAALTEAGFDSSQVEMRFSHRYTTPEFVHIQKACSVASLAYLNPTCHLNVHPTYGPWISLRALLVFDLEMIFDDPATPSPPPPPLPNPFPEGDERIAQVLGEIIAPGYQATWGDWLKLRDAAGDFDPAREHRFCDAQLEYHYTHNQELLRRAPVNR